MGLDCWIFMSAFPDAYRRRAWRHYASHIGACDMSKTCIFRHMANGEAVASQDAAIGDASRHEANGLLDPHRKSEYGQFMTPDVTASFMASLFTKPNVKCRLLDAGAGVGSLTIAFLNRMQAATVHAELWEIDPIMQEFLRANIDAYRAAHERFTATVHGSDFINDAVWHLGLAQGEGFDYAILNPPYSKLNSNSTHRSLLRQVGIETVNLYTAFVALAVLMMKQRGEIVAIIPRSFCNGPYYRPFRELLFRHCALRQIHLFGSRKKAFKDDKVLQENVIIHLVKGGRQDDVTITTSEGLDYDSLTKRTVAFAEIVKPSDSERFIHIPTVSSAEGAAMSPLFRKSLRDIGIQVCTGPVVDFRLRGSTRKEPAPGAVPLLYPHHFRGGKLRWPNLDHKKPNAIEVDDASRRWLMPNGWYVIVKRFSSKEEKRRIVAYILDPSAFDAELLGFENHWNVFHVGKSGLEKKLAIGLAAFLNSTVVDRHFRLFSGHTQVNATDLRNMLYPSAEGLLALGGLVGRDPTQNALDEAVAKLERGYERQGKTN